VDETAERASVYGPRPDAGVKCHREIKDFEHRQIEQCFPAKSVTFYLIHQKMFLLKEPIEFDCAFFSKFSTPGIL